MGDVLGIVDGSGNIIVRYRYNAWGLPIETVDSNTTTANALVENNSLLYRSYCYDSDLGMYYLQSRFYDPTLCRFVNADGTVFINCNDGGNLFAYCGNNPVNRIDLNGKEHMDVGCGSGSTTQSIALFSVGYDHEKSATLGGESLVFSLLGYMCASVSLGTEFLSRTSTGDLDASIHAFALERMDRNGVSYWSGVSVKNLIETRMGSEGFSVEVNYAKYSNASASYTASYSNQTGDFSLRVALSIEDGGAKVENYVEYSVDGMFGIAVATAVTVATAVVCPPAIPVALTLATVVSR